MSDNKYRIIISADIDTKSKDDLPKQIKELTKDIQLEIKKILISPEAKKNLTNEINSILKDAKIEDVFAFIKEREAKSAKEKVDGINKSVLASRELENVSAEMLHGEENAAVLKDRVMKALEAQGAEVAKITLDTEYITTKENERLEIVKKMVAYYTDMAGISHSTTFGWENIGTKEKPDVQFIERESKYVEDQIAAEKLRNKIQKEYSDQIKDASQKADELFEKTKNKSQYASEVRNVKAATSALKERAAVLLSSGEITKEQMEGFIKLENDMNKAGATMQAQGKNIQNWGVEIGVAIKRTLEWASAMTLLYGSLRQIQAGIEYIKELNKEMVSIQAVTGQTDAQTNELARSYNDMAKEMGVTTLEVAKGSLEFIRQGKSVSETRQLLKTSLMMSKLAAIDSAQATEYMTSIMNGFNLETKDMMGALDTLVALDNKYATSVGEIAAAMQKTSVSAQQAGVTYEQLASYITIISSTSRQSAESIGTSLKTIFARLTDVKLGKKLDEEGESISNVEEVLKKHNIFIRDQSLQFRDMGDVIDEVGKKWETLGGIEQSEILKAMAGTYQREKALILFENYNKVLTAQGVASNNAGLAQERYQIVLGGVEAAQNRFTSSWEGLWQKTLSSDAIKNVYNLLASILELMDKIGGLIPSIAVGLEVFSLFKAKDVVEFFLESSAEISQYTKQLRIAKETTTGFIASFVSSKNVETASKLESAAATKEEIAAEIESIAVKKDAQVQMLEDAALRAELVAREKAEIAQLAAAEATRKEQFALGLSSSVYADIAYEKVKAEKNLNEIKESIADANANLYRIKASLAQETAYPTPIFGKSKKKKLEEEYIEASEKVTRLRNEEVWAAVELSAAEENLQEALSNNNSETEKSVASKEADVAATKARVDANNAATEAENANTAAIEARKIANEANAKAEAANAEATEASAAATSEKTVAENVNSTAKEASTVANTANTVSGEVNTAETSANTASTGSNSVAADVNTAAKTANAAATAALTFVMQSLNIVLLVATAVWMGINYVQEENRKKTEANKKATEDLGNALENLNSTDTKKLIDRFNELRNATKLATGEQEEFYNIQKQLHALLPDLKVSYDELGRVQIENGQDINAALDSEIKKRRELLSLSIASGEKQAREDYVSKKEEIASKKAELEKISKYEFQSTSTGAKSYWEQKKRELQYEVENAGYEAQSQLDAIISSYAVANQDVKSLIKSSWESFAKEGKAGAKEVLDGIKRIDDLLAASGNVMPGTSSKDAAQVKKLQLAYGDLIDDIGRMNDAVKSVDFGASLKNGSTLLQDLANEANDTFNQIRDNFFSGKTDSEQFLKSVSNIVDTYKQIGEYAVSNSDALGLESAQVDNLKTALSNLSISQSQLNSVQSLNIEIANAQAQVSGGVLPQAVAQGLAKVIIDSGMTFDILRQNGANTAEQIVTYLTTVVGGFSALTGEAANITNGYLINTAQNANSLKGILGFLTGVRQSNIDLSGYSIVGAGTPTDLSAVSGGGGGGSGKSAEQIRLEKEISLLEDKKKALQDTLDVFNNYIEAQKEALKLQKEEKSFTDDLAAKNKALAKLKSDIAILALDDSEEAKAKRIKLEEDAAKAEEEITKTTEDRKYQVQVDALDKQKKDFEDNIKSQIAALDKRISKYQEESSAIQSAGGSISNNADKTINLENVTKTAIDNIVKKYTEMYNMSEKNSASLRRQITSWTELGLSIMQILSLARDFGLATQESPKVLPSGTAYKNLTGTYNGIEYKNGVPVATAIRHSGVDSGFVGGLASNEEFAKLMKGELVVNPKDMNKFVKSTLPSMVGTASNYGGISLSMPLTVQGNLDSSVLPDIEKIANKVISTINNSMKNRGYIRASNLVSV